MIRRFLVAMAIVCGTLLPSAALFAQHDAEADHAPTAHADAGTHEKPQLLPNPTKRETWLQALWTTIIFLALVVILYFTAWKQVLIGLKNREERIRKDIADAEAARKRAEATLREYNQQLATAEARVRDMLAKATADGEQLATSIRMKAQHEAEEIKERTQRDLEGAKQSAIREIREMAADLATSVAEKILRRNINAEDQRELVRSSLEELGTMKV